MSKQPLSPALSFARLIRQTRRDAGLRQEDLALLANVGRRFIIDLEAGKPTCEMGKALSVAAVLGVQFSVSKSK